MPPPPRQIDNAHVAHADGDRVLMARAPLCLELAQAHCWAVDFPKTGVPPRFEKRHVPRVSASLGLSLSSSLSLGSEGGLGMGNEQVGNTMTESMEDLRVG